jgi:hypothetical protein
MDPPSNQGVPSAPRAILHLCIVEPRQFPSSNTHYGTKAMLRQQNNPNFKLLFLF